MATPRDPFSDLPDLDPSRKATEQLNAVMGNDDAHEDIVILDERLASGIAERRETEEEVKEEAITAVPETREEILAREARFEAPVLEMTSERDSVRLLVLSKNTSVLQLGSLAQKRFLELSSLFAEIHVIILNESIEETVATIRLADNVWLYSTESSSWWMTPLDAYRTAREQLVFAGGFRADVIIAEDAFESAAAAYAIARKYERPFQVHVLEDIYDPEFKERDPHNGLRLLASSYLFKKTDCVRTSSDYIKSRVIAENPGLADYTETLPLYYNLEAWRDMEPTMNLKERYPQFKFFILHVSGMRARSHTGEVVSGVAPLLHMYPTIGLIIVGNGPYRSAIEKQVMALGVQHQVVFEPVPDEVISHMKSANVLIHLSEDPEEDAYVLEAAAVKLPIIASTANISGTLLRDNETAFLCNGADPSCVSYRLRAFLNDNQARTRFALGAQEAVFERIEQDYTAYLTAYRSSIERCL
jgi:glycosyltransferase involved in cell wall biosynthesis